MADIRIKELTELTELTDNDYFVVDNSASGGETKKYRATRVTEMIDAVADEIEEKITPSIDTALAVGSVSGDIASFSDGSNLPMPKLQVGIEPQQDLHGYDYPWVGGSEKNKIPMTVDGIKGANPSATWNGNSTTINGVTFSIQTDGDGNVIGLNANGIASGDSPSLYLARNVALADGSYVLNGCPNNGSLQSYGIFADYSSGGNIPDYGSGTTLNISNVTLNIRTRISNGYTANNLTFKPMIRLASVTDATFAPYSNICPISGWDEANVTRYGKNLFGGLPLANAIVDAGGTLDTANKTVSFTHGNSQVNILENIKLKESTSYTFILTYSNAGNNNCLSLFYKTSGTRYPINLNNSSDTKTTIVYTTSVVTIDKLVLGWVLDASTKIYYEESGLFEGELTASDFEAYNGHTYTIDLDGTRYGGTLDVISGVLTVDRAYVDLGTLTWGKSSTEATVLYTGITGKKTGVSPMICDRYKYVRDKGFALDFGSVSDSSNASYVGTTFIRNSDFAGKTAVECATLLSGTQLVYELATPIEIQLTPTQVKSLLGSNNVWADTGEIIDCEYKRDATAIINSLIARIEALENQ